MKLWAYLERHVTLKNVRNFLSWVFFAIGIIIVSLVVWFIAAVYRAVPYIPVPVPIMNFLTINGLFYHLLPLYIGAFIIGSFILSHHFHRLAGRT